jgi:hypothetical protein
MKNFGFFFIIILGLFLFFQSIEIPANAKEKGETASKSKEWKIENAMSAGPASISKDATIMDWPEKEGGEAVLLRKGTNDWTCFPDMAHSPGNDPMCLDKSSMQWVDAWMKKEPPKLTQPGITYMLQGGSDASNTDPFAKHPKPGEDWVNAPPHIMIFPVGKLDPKVYGTDPNVGAPWVMFAGTPYEHLMIPVK